MKVFKTVDDTVLRCFTIEVNVFEIRHFQNGITDEAFEGSAANIESLEVAAEGEDDVGDFLERLLVLQRQVHQGEAGGELEGGDVVAVEAELFEGEATSSLGGAVGDSPRADGEGELLGSSVDGLLGNTRVAFCLSKVEGRGDETGHWMMIDVGRIF